jgi:protein TonB
LVLDQEGRVLQYRLLTSSGSLLFDQSAIDALSKVTQVRPPPEGMDRTVVVKFFPPA